MGMNLAMRSEDFTSAEDHSWLGSAHGTSEANSITLAGDAFLATFADGIVPSGVVVAKYTSGANTGLYGPYDDAGADGLDTAAYHLLTTVDVDAANGGVNTAAAGLWHGEVIESKLPTGHGLTASAKTDLKQIRYS